MKPTKRQMLFIPEVNPVSFVYFYERGDSGISWSIGDYSVADQIDHRGPKRHPSWTAHGILKMALHAENARESDEKLEDTDNHKYWHQRTLKLNREYGLGIAASTRRTKPNLFKPRLP